MHKVSAPREKDQRFPEAQKDKQFKVTEADDGEGRQGLVAERQQHRQTMGGEAGSSNSRSW